MSTDDSAERAREIADGIEQMLARLQGHVMWNSKGCGPGKSALITLRDEDWKCVLAALRATEQPAPEKGETWQRPENIDAHPLRYSKLESEIERVLSRRLAEKRLDGYLLETAIEIAEKVQPSHPADAGSGEDDIVVRLGAACVGHPNAEIPWPHRLLHDAKRVITETRNACTMWYRDFTEMQAENVRLSSDLSAAREQIAALERQVERANRVIEYAETHVKSAETERDASLQDAARLREAIKDIELGAAKEQYLYDNEMTQAIDRAAALVRE